MYVPARVIYAVGRLQSGRRIIALPLQPDVAAEGTRLYKECMEFTAVFRKVPEGYIAFVEELPGANTQAATLDEAHGRSSRAIDSFL